MFFPSEFSSQVKKYIKKLDPVAKKRIENRIDKPEENPFPSDVERVEKYKGEKPFRVRVGKYRILYLVRHNPNRLLIAKLDKRDRIYN